MKIINKVAVGIVLGGGLIFTLDMVGKLYLCKTWMDKLNK